MCFGIEEYQPFTRLLISLVTSTQLATVPSHASFPIPQPSLFDSCYCNELLPLKELDAGRESPQLCSQGQQWYFLTSMDVRDGAVKMEEQSEISVLGYRGEKQAMEKKNHFPLF